MSYYKKSDNKQSNKNSYKWQMERKQIKVTNVYWNGMMTNRGK